MTPHTPDDVAHAAMVACLLEVAAPKPGNVTRYRDLPDLTLEAFLISAAAIGPAMARAGTRPVGETVLAAIAATRRHTATNTNLGIVLLLAPLAAAALRQAAGAPVALRERVRAVLATLSVDDARLAYRAIRMAVPGGLGTVDEQDVAQEPTADLLTAMRLAAERDSLAREYATDYAITFELTYPALAGYLARGHDAATAIVGAYLEVLARTPDSLIARRHGPRRAADVSQRAAAALAAGEVGTAAGLAALAEFDEWLRAADPTLNPGTSADLVTAAIFVALLEDVLVAPRARRDEATAPPSGLENPQPGGGAAPADGRGSS
jgi:triphosphoribosyl-dephospho-CoA synthase